MDYGFDRTKKYWGDDLESIDLEALARECERRKAEAAADFGVPEEVTVKDDKEVDLKDMKSDIRSLHIMVELLLEKIEGLEEEIKKHRNTINYQDTKKRAVVTKKVTPDSKRMKNAKIDDCFEKHPCQTMTQIGHVTVFGTTKTGATL